MKGIILAGIIGVMFWGAARVEAAIGYGTGYYTNLCDSGTEASYYSCDEGCDPNTGRCQGEKEGVVRWVCTGKWNQCLESESGWSNEAELGNPGCGKTVQISLFDKKCRREDLTWDDSCRLLGYMVWYSGDCRAGFGTPTVGPTVKEVQPSIRPTSSLPAGGEPTPTPSPKSKFPLLSPAVTPSTGLEQVCGKKCDSGTACQAGFVCVEGECRNPSCVEDKTCFCGQKEEKAVASGNPETGVGTWVGVAAMIGLGALGWKMWRWARSLW